MFDILDSDDDKQEEKEHYQSEVAEDIACVRIVIGGGYAHSSELKFLNFK